jgi:hypothetical protein
VDGHLLYLLHVEFGGEEGLLALWVSHGVLIDGEDLGGRGFTWLKL